MLPRLPLAVRLLLPSVVLATFALPPASVRGQRLADGDKALEAKEREHRKLILDLRKGVTRFNPEDKDHLEAVDLLAKRAVYPYAWVEYQREPGKTQKVFDGFEGDLGQFSKGKPATEKLITYYSKKVIERADEVLTKGKPIAAVNAGRVLARLVEREAKQTESAWQDEMALRLGDGNAGQLLAVLLKVVGDPKQNDGAKYYALRGLGQLLAVPADKEGLKDPDREKVVNAVIPFVQRKPTYPATAPTAIVDGFRAVRREGVKALARVRNPTLGAKDKVSVVLLRVVAKDTRVVPEPRLDERLEAAIGLANMRPGSKDADYQPDYAAEHLGRFVADFLVAANANIEEKKPPKRVRPWRVDAARLAEALDGMKKEVKNKYAGDVVDQSAKHLAAIEKGSKATRSTDLDTWLNRNPAPTKELLKGVADSAVKKAAAIEDD
jgi:hypothetical protein